MHQSRRPHSISRVCTSALMLWFAVASVCLAQPATDPHPISRFVRQNPTLTAVALTPGKPVHAVIRGPEVGRYTLELKKGDFAAVELSQVGGDMIAVMFDPEGKLLEIADRSNRGEPEVATVVAGATGRYSVQVAVFDWRTPSTEYAIELTRRAPAAATPLARAEQLLDAWYDGENPGAAVAILRDGKVVYRKFAGEANIEHGVPISDRTKFDIASVSKQFTGLAVAMLIDQGRIAQSDDIRKYLPEVPDFGKPITIGHLLNHTSGLRDWDAPLGLAGMRIEDGVTLDRILAFVANQKSLNFAPGEQQTYSNTGYNLLALLVSRVTGQPFEQWAEEHLFRPLGMRDTAFNPDPHGIIAGKAASYEGRLPAKRATAGDTTAAMGSSSLWTTLDDLALWVRYLDSGLDDRPSLAKLYRSQGALNDGKSTGYAFGNWYGQRQNVPMIGHLGLAAGYRASLHRFPEQHLAVIYLSNDGNDATYARAVAIENLFLPVAEETVEVPSDDSATLPPEPKPEVSSLPAYAGLYYSDALNTAYRVEVRGDRIEAVHPVNGRIVMKYREPDIFTTGEWYMPEARFVRDAAGRVTGLRVSTENARDMAFEKMR